MKATQEEKPSNKKIFAVLAAAVATLLCCCVIVAMTIGMYFFVAKEARKGSEVMFIQNSTDPSAKSWVSKIPTQCAEKWDEWESGESFSYKDGLIRQYFKSELNINVYNIKWENINNNSVCLACSCLSTQKLLLEIDSKNLDEVKGLGFEKE